MEILFIIYLIRFFTHFIYSFFLTGKSAYAVESNEYDMRLEIMTNGPIEAAFMVFKDFLTYKSGEKKIQMYF